MATKQFRRTVPPIKLDRHPELHWPPGIAPNPPWTGPSPEVPDPLRVILTSVELVQNKKHSERRLRLTGSYDGNVYYSTMSLEDPAVLNSLYKLLGTFLGQTIARIGSAQVDRSLKRI